MFRTSQFCRSSSTKPSMDSADSLYHCDANELETLRQSKPWMNDAKYFDHVAIAPSAVMKIMMHCQTGVRKGIAKGGNPIEVMGLLVGRPMENGLVVTDAFALPIEGFETRVVADDESVVNHMIALGEALEQTRTEKFMGWYHSHPFDLNADGSSHCFLSQTDLTTQLQWQRAEDPHGNPFVAIVVDPLLTTHTGTPQMGAFRALPPEYNNGALSPDGSVLSETERLERWGSCWNAYYELKIEYFMSRTSRDVLNSLTQDYLWISTLESTAPKDQPLKNAAKALETPSVATGTGSRSSTLRGAASINTKELGKAVGNLTEAATEQVVQQALQASKLQVFGK